MGKKYNDSKLNNEETEQENSARAGEDEDIFDPQLLNLFKTLLDKEDGVYAINPARVAEIVATQNKMQKLVHGLVRYNISEPPFAMGCVSANSKTLHFDDPRALAALARSADAFEVFAKTDGTVQVELSFHGVVDRIGEGK